MVRTHTQRWDGFTVFSNDLIYS
jgi:DnaJ-class molecular chaperone